MLLHFLGRGCARGDLINSVFSFKIRGRSSRRRRVLSCTSTHSTLRGSDGYSYRGAGCRVHLLLASWKIIFFFSVCSRNNRLDLKKSAGTRHCAVKDTTLAAVPKRLGRVRMRALFFRYDNGCLLHRYVFFHCTWGPTDDSITRLACCGWTPIEF